MKQIGLILLLTVVTAYPVLAQTARKVVPPGRSAERQLIELERQLSDALVRQDAKVLDRLWSNALVFTFPNGKVSNKAQRLAGQKPAAQPTRSGSKTINDEVRVHLYGNTAVVTVLSTWSGQANNEAYSSQFQATHVWVKQRGRWQLVAAHVSPVKE